MNRVCLTKDGKFVEMQGGGKVDRLSEDTFNAEIKKNQPEATYEQYLIDCDALEVMRLNTLKQNALNAGYAEADIEVKWITDAEWAVIQADLNKPSPEQIAEKEKESLIQAKIREQAITVLKAEGKLDKDGKIPK